MREYTFDTIEINTEETFDVQITEEMMSSFKDLSGDCNPLHCDLNYATESGFNSRVVYGMLTSSFYSTLAGVYLPGKYCLLQGVDTKFHKPVFIGDTLKVSGIVAQKHDVFQMIVVKCKIENQNNEVVSTAIIKAGLLKSNAQL